MPLILECYTLYPKLLLRHQISYGVSHCQVTQPISYSAMNGILEMPGFHSTFQHLYVDDNSTLAQNNTCSSGNGASSDIVIVRINTACSVI